MAGQVRDEEAFLLAILNSTPAVDGVPTDEWADHTRARAWLASAGGSGSAAELQHMNSVRQLLQAVVRGERPPDVLGPVLRGATCTPAMAGGQIAWTLSAPAERELAVRAVLAWDTLARNSPGRLRPCANEECRLFLIDHSKAGTARWCSMAVCGNRMKARRHYQRARSRQRPAVGAEVVSASGQGSWPVRRPGG
jgi:predicted RNA-binding Zn ribbon-like protein